MESVLFSVFALREFKMHCKRHNMLQGKFSNEGRKKFKLTEKYNRGQI